MSFAEMQSFIAVALGFAVAGSLATFYQFMTERPASFTLITKGPSFVAFAAIPFLTFAAPFIIMRNIILDKDRSRRLETVMLATIVAGIWSLMSGTAFVMALEALGFLTA